MKLWIWDSKYVIILHRPRKTGHVVVRMRIVIFSIKFGTAVTHLDNI